MITAGPRCWQLLGDAGEDLCEGGWCPDEQLLDAAGHLTEALLHLLTVAAVAHHIPVQYPVQLNVEILLLLL